MSIGYFQKSQFGYEKPSETPINLILCCRKYCLIEIEHSGAIALLVANKNRNTRSSQFKLKLLLLVTISLRIVNNIINICFRFLTKIFREDQYDF